MFTKMPKKTKVFISYARADKVEAEQLDERLRAGGLLTWRDLKDSSKGSPLETQIEAALKDDCSAFLMYLTPRAGKSDYINKIEVKLARELWIAKQLTIIPVFRCVLPAAATKSVQEHLGFDISPFDGIVLPDPLTCWKRATAWVNGDRDAARNQLKPHFSELARRMLETHLKASVTGPNLTLRLHTYEYAAGAVASDIELDWSPVFKTPAADWNDSIAPVIADVRRAMTAACSARQLTIEGGGHLSAAAMLGHTFSSASGFHLTVMQNGTPWAARTPSAQALPLSKQEEPGSPSRSDVTLEISISNDIGGGVDGFMRGQPGRFRKRIRLSLVGGPNRLGVRDNDHANAIVGQIFQEIRAIRQDPNLGTIHIFISAPFGLAVLTGHALNACGPVQFYEFEKTKNAYVPSFAIGTGDAQ